MWLLVLLGGCGLGRLEQRTPPTVPFDVVIVPGCPSKDDGRPSRCQLGRAIWAAILWERGWAERLGSAAELASEPTMPATP